MPALLPAALGLFLALALPVALAAPAPGDAREAPEPAAAPAPQAPPAKGKRGRKAAAETLLLDGVTTQVRWSDGDTFRVKDGPRAGERFRLEGVNALESYGPVHRFGGSTGAELLQVARDAAARVRREAWRCTVLPRGGGYGRGLAACPDAARALVGEGLALVLAIDAPPDPALVALQREAQAAGRGMWARGAPPLVPTSLHSQGEDGAEGRAYDRIADTRTGRAERRSHGARRATCEEVCVGEGPDRACMTYVPFERRYQHRPPCLRPGR